MPNLRSSGKIVGASVSVRKLAKQYKVPQPISLRKLIEALGVRGSPEIQFQFGTHNLSFGNFSDGVPDWGTFKETFGGSEVYHEAFDPIFGHPILTLAFFELYKYYLKGTANGGLATGFCTSLASLVADSFWTGRADTYSITKASVHKQLTAVHGKLLSRESLLYFHDQGVEGLARVERSCREIETIFLRGCTRKSAPLLFFIPAGGILSGDYFDKLGKSHCVMPYRFAYPPGHPGPRLAPDGRTTVGDLDNVELYVWDCNHPESPNCKLVFKNNGGRLDYQYFAASSTALFSSQDGITLGMMTNGNYMLADHDMPFSGTLGFTNFILDFLLSPADLQITDAKGLKTGNFDGKIYAEIPGSLPCYLVPKAYLLPSDAALERRIAGTGRGRYTYNSITPDGGSVVLQGLTTAAGQVDVLSMNPDQTELRFTPAVAKKFNMTVARRVGDQVRAMVISGIGGDRNAEFRFNTSTELGFANLVNTGGNRKVGIQTMVLDKQGKLTQKPRVTSVNMSANSELTMEMLDWNLLDNSVPVVRKH
ncbi:hypothetical protein QZJ86_18895 [Methylomonas montana]|uniref:hypothetical protein n=1 Tax=Methylomonas montana TaxID=3058963 RepID=UPI00265ABB6E|nr:hypothetical protein [Methylomonas montana]WKJ90052.1 hypothetical protein QZJ86_18895 [Methylomonas montana]